MTDVELGGGTVFPFVNIALQARKGTAAVWYNLHASGEPNMLTYHAACPVLLGNKWSMIWDTIFITYIVLTLLFLNILVCNKWIYEDRQTFKRPCELTPDHPVST